MSAFTDVIERVRALLFSRRDEREMDEELRFHVEREVDARVRRGADPAQARREALIAFGGVERYKEDVRDARGVRPLQDVAADARYALRALGRNPVFTAAAVAVLALGIGATTAVFSVADAVIIAELPYPSPDRIVRVVQRSPQSTMWQLSTVDVQALRAEQRSFSVFGVQAWAQVSLRANGSPEQASMGRADAGFFKVFGVTAAQGRLVEERDEAVGAPLVVVVSYALAERMLGGAASAVGRSVNIDGNSHVVVGVLPPDVTSLGGLRTVAWTPLQLTQPNRRGPFWMRGFGRLRDDATMLSAGRDLAALSQRIFPLWASGFRDSTTKFTPMPLREAMVGNSSKQVGLFAGGVGLVFLVAVANVAMLMLVRGSQRQQELAIRGALGAGTSRLARLLLTESVVLTLISVVAALAVAAFALKGVKLLSPNLPRIAAASLDARAIGFTILAALVSGVLVSIAPTSFALRGRSLAFGGDSKRAGTSQRTSLLQSGFVVAEFALALPLLFGAGLLLNSFVRLQQVDPGFDPAGAVAVNIGLPSSRYAQDDSIASFWRRLEQRVSEIPGVSSAGLALAVPPDDPGDENNFDLIEHPVPPGTPEHVSPWNYVSNGFFTTMGIKLLDGRTFTIGDSANAPPVILVTRSWAARFYPGERAVGGRMISGGCTTCPPTVIVGVVSDVKYQGLENPGEAIYIPTAQTNNRTMNVVARTSSPAATFRAIRAIVGSLDPELSVVETTLQQEVDKSIATPLHWSVALTVFAGSAVVLAAFGIFGLMSYVVRQRQREIGVRMALGAEPRAITRMVVVRGMRYAAIGTAVGLVIALVESRWLAAFLYGVEATDPLTLIGVGTLLLLVALVACWLPGLRAARVHPVRAIASD